MTENILEVRNLVKDYGDFSLKQLNFDVPRGSIVGLIGENGAGKSTTINCILNEVQKNSGENKYTGLIISNSHYKSPSSAPSSSGFCLTRGPLV